MHDCNIFFLSAGVETRQLCHSSIQSELEQQRETQQCLFGYRQLFWGARSRRLWRHFVFPRKNILQLITEHKERCLFVEIPTKLGRLFLWDEKPASVSMPADTSDCSSWRNRVKRGHHWLVVENPHRTWEGSPVLWGRTWKLELGRNYWLATCVR